MEPDEERAGIDVLHMVDARHRADLFLDPGQVRRGNVDLHRGSGAAHALDDALDRVVDEQLALVDHGDLVTEIGDLPEQVGAHENQLLLSLELEHDVPDLGHAPGVETGGGLV